MVSSQLRLRGLDQVNLRDRPGDVSRTKSFCSLTWSRVPLTSEQSLLLLVELQTDPDPCHSPTAGTETTTCTSRSSCPSSIVLRSRTPCELVWQTTLMPPTTVPRIRIMRLVQQAFTWVGTNTTGIEVKRRTTTTTAIPT